MNKKSLAALAVLGCFAASASAQSGLQIYGFADGGLEYVNSSIDGVASKFGLASGQQSGSRFGLKGSEALGGSLKLVFQLESGFSIDDGKTTMSMSDGSSRLFGREARLGLEGQFGSLNFGRFGTLGSGAGSVNMFDDADPFSTGFIDAGVQATQAFTVLRVDNAVAYKTPKLAGLQGGLMYSFATEGNEQAGADRNNRYSGVALTYGVGKLWAAASYEQVQPSQVNPTLADDEVLKLALNYDFGFIKPYLAYSHAEGAQKFGRLSLAGTGAKSDSYMLGLTAPLLGGKLMASVQYLDADLNSVLGEDAERTVASVGYDYPLSRRTNLYGVYSYSQGGKAFDEDRYTVAGLSAAQKSAIETVNRSALQVGVRHKF